MHKLESIANQIREKFDIRTARRDQALAEEHATQALSEGTVDARLFSGNPCRASR